MKRKDELVAWLSSQIELEKALIGPGYRYSEFPQEECENMKDLLKDRE